jgi:hypothetical protein
MVRLMVLYDQPEDTEAFDRHYREIHIRWRRSFLAFAATGSAAMLVRFRAARPITWSPSSTGMTSTRSSEISGRLRGGPTLRMWRTSPRKARCGA